MLSIKMVGSQCWTRVWSEVFHKRRLAREKAAEREMVKYLYSILNINWGKRDG